MTASEGFKHDREYIRRNRRAPIVDGECHRVAVLVRPERDGRSAAVLYRIANQITYD
jgi:hypothetical protein